AVAHGDDRHDHRHRAGGDAVAGRRRDPRLRLRHALGRGGRHLFDGLSGQERGAVAGRAPRLGRNRREEEGPWPLRGPALMAMAPVDFTGAVPIDGYGPGFFRVGGKVWHGAVLVHEGGVIPWGGLGDLAALALLAGTADLLLLGTGAEIARAPEA